MKLYCEGLSAPSRAVHVFMKATGLHFDVKKMTIIDGDTRTAEYLAVNPYGGVPCLEDDGFVLPESTAILVYLCEKNQNIPDHWYPKDLKLRSKINQYLGWHPTGVRKFMTEVFLERTYRPVLAKTAFNEKAWEEHVKNAEPSLKKFEDLYLQTNQFIFGDEISIADLLATSELFQMTVGKYDMKTNHPKISHYMDRVRVHTNPHFDNVFRKAHYVREFVSAGQFPPFVLPDDPDMV